MRIPHTLWKWINAFQYPLKPKLFLCLTGAFIYFCSKPWCESILIFIHCQNLHQNVVLQSNTHLFNPWIELGNVWSRNQVCWEGSTLKYCSFLEDLASLYVLLKRYLPQTTPSLTTLRPSFMIQDEIAIDCLSRFSFKDSILIIKVANGLGLHYLKGG